MWNLSGALSSASLVIIPTGKQREIRSFCVSTKYYAAGGGLLLDIKSGKNEHKTNEYFLKGLLKLISAVQAEVDVDVDVVAVLQ